MSGASAKPLPKADPTTAPFWESVKNEAMALQYSPATGKYLFYPRGFDPAAPDSQLEWRPVAGTGVVHAFPIVYRHPNPAFQGDIPYVVAMIELDEGVRLMSNLVDVPADPEHVKVGMPVEVVYEKVNDEVTLPKFRPRRG
jgi:uncharacterized protein